VSTLKMAEEHFNAGNALLGIGKFDAAIVSFRRALAIKPDFAEAHYNLGIALQNIGQLDAAAESYRRTLKVKPNLFQAHINLGNACMTLGKLDEAVASFRSVLKIKPDFAEIHNNLGIALQALEQPDNAMAHFRRALEINPGYAEAYVNLGVVLQDLGQFDGAVACFREAIKSNPDYALAHNNLGALLHYVEHPDEAEASLRRAITLKPDYAEAHANLCNVLVVLGNTGEAENLLGKAIELNPCNANLLATALSHFSYRQDDPRFQQLDAVYTQRESLPSDERIKLNFAMGKAMEGVGEYDKSFAAYEEGNHLSYRKRPFDEAKEDRFLEKICGYFSPDIFKKFSGIAGTLPSMQDQRTPIFIVGIPRSGTTLIEQILSSHPAVFGAGELSALNDISKKAEPLLYDSTGWDATASAMRKLGEEYLDQVWKLAPDATRITDKLPGNYRNLGLIHLMLPNAKIIHAMRNPMDVSFSCYTTQFWSGHEYSFDLEAMGRQYLRYMQLMRHWHGVLPAGRVLDVRYEDIVAEPEREVKRMLNYLELPWNPACLSFHENKRAVHTASVAQVRKPLYSSSVARWERFEKHLHPLLEIIRPAMNTEAESPRA